jgi:hypothetical protein
MTNANVPSDTAQAAAAEFAKPVPVIVQKTDNVGFNGGFDIFTSRNGPNITITPEVKLSSIFESLSFLDFGYMGDNAARRDMNKICWETHGYPFPGLPVHPVVEYKWFSHYDDVLRAGIATKPLVIKKRIKIFPEFYPLTGVGGDELSDHEMQLWIRGGINFGKGITGYGMMKRMFLKDKKDFSFGKLGVKYQIGKNYYVKAEYRDWPLPRNKRNRAVYFGVGRNL